MSDQRRQFFRIQDEGIIYLEKIEGQNLAQFKQDILDQVYDETDVFKRFFKFENDLQSMFLNNKTLSPDWLKMMNILNSKINQMAMLLAPNYETLFNQPPQTINLSANGLGIDYPMAFSENESVKIELILLPQCTYLSALAKVVYCIKKDQGTEAMAYTLGLQLEVIRPQDTDRLIQHIMKKEAEWLKYRRTQALNSENKQV